MKTTITIGEIKIKDNIVLKELTSEEVGSVKELTTVYNSLIKLIEAIDNNL